MGEEGAASRGDRGGGDDDATVEGTRVGGTVVSVRGDDTFIEAYWHSCTNTHISS